MNLSKIESSVLFRLIKLGKLEMIDILDRARTKRNQMVIKVDGPQLELMENQVEHAVFSLNTVDRIEEALGTEEGITISKEDGIKQGGFIW